MSSRAWKHLLRRAPLFPAQTSPGAERRLLLMLCLAGFCLRVVGISFGLPDHIYHDDTSKQLYRVPRFMTGALIPADTYPTLHMYVVALLLTGLSIIDPHMDPRSSLTLIAVTARLLNAILSTGIIALVYVSGRSLFGWRAAALAAALTAVSPLDILHAHYEMGDIPQAFFVTASFTAAVRVMLAGHTSAYLAAGTLAGLAASAKFYGAVVLGVVVLAAFAGPRSSWRRTFALLAAASLLGGAIFVLTTPKLLLTPVDFIESLRQSAELFTVPPPPLWQRPFVGGKVLIGLSFESFGVPLVVVATLAAVLLLPRSREGRLLLMAPAMVVLVYVMWRPNYLDDRNLVILAPFVHLMSGALIVRSFKQRAVIATLGRAIAIVLLAWGTLNSLHTGYLFWQDDTRLFAERWAKTQLPPTPKIAVNVFEDTPERYRSLQADLLLAYSRNYERHIDWYSPFRSDHVRRALDFLGRHGKLLKRFELLPRGFTATTVSYYDLDSMDVPHVFPQPEDAARDHDSLIFLDPEAVPERLGIMIGPRHPVRHTLVSRVPLNQVGVALSGIGKVSVRHGWRSVRLQLQPGQLKVVFFRPWRSFPWFKYFYPLTITTQDSLIYARITPTPCDAAFVFVTYEQWDRAMPHLEACRGARWVEAARLLDLAWVHVKLAQHAEAERVIQDLGKKAPGLWDALSTLARDEDDEAWRERYRRLAGHPRWFWEQHTFTIEGEDAPTRVGIVVDAADAHGGKVVLAQQGRTQPGYLKVWFPQHFLRGHYLIRFRLRGAGTNPDPLATLSVVRHFQNRVYDVLATHEWSSAALKKNSFQDVELRVFTDIEPINLEARVFYHGNGSLEIDDISILPDVWTSLSTKMESLRWVLKKSRAPRTRAGMST